MPSIADEARIALDNLADRTGSLFQPTLRLGVAGLSRAGKTVFITALVHNLLAGGRLPFFEARASGRIAATRLDEQPDLGVPRFAYEEHLARLAQARDWPHSTRAVSELRLTIEYQSASAFARLLPAGRLTLDIVDYPGEWLLDLPLLEKDFATFSREALERARRPGREALAAPFLARLAETDPAAPADEPAAQALARAFTDYLRACRADGTALSTLPPGRFLMPGDLDGSPALTFAPLELDPERTYSPASLAALFAGRYGGYQSVVAKPFFREHFARLDRQILLVDALQAINAGPAALGDLETALTEIFRCFRPGRANFLASFLTRRIDRILVAATKADHLHRDAHDRLEAIVRRLVDGAAVRARLSGARVETIALAAVRATREASVPDPGGHGRLPVIVGTPMAGERIGAERFDGARETAIFPGDLPADPATLFGAANAGAPIRFVRFRPPRLETSGGEAKLVIPHIRLDRALQFLIGDKLA